MKFIGIVLASAIAGAQAFGPTLPQTTKLTSSKYESLTLSFILVSRIDVPHPNEKLYIQLRYLPKTMCHSLHKAEAQAKR